MHMLSHNSCHSDGQVAMVVVMGYNKQVFF